MKSVLSALAAAALAVRRRADDKAPEPTFRVKEKAPSPSYTVGVLASMTPLEALALPARERFPLVPSS